MSTRLGRNVSFLKPIRLSLRCFSTEAKGQELYPTKLKLYNSLTRKKVEFVTKSPNLVTWYMCGPTVYDSAHIGHASCYMKFDILRRVMQDVFQLNIVQAMGITDIDDKIINRAKQENVSTKEITTKYELEFRSDLLRLGILQPTLFTRVSDHVEQILQFVQGIVDQQLGYLARDGSVYFDVAKYSQTNRYGKLSPAGTSSEEPENPDKKSSLDFALWKGTKFAWEPSWNTPWGTKGRPGWHIECSAMASHVFGPWLDLHSGGIDLLFPHHENEEAQCCAYHKTTSWAGHWIHTGHLHLSGDTKMSKSLKNTVSIGDFLAKHSAEHLRMLCLLSHYRNQMEFDESKLENARGVLKKIHDCLADCEAYVSGRLPRTCIDEPLLESKLAEAKLSIYNALSDDCNTAAALETVTGLITLTNKQIHAKSEGTVTSGVATIAAISNLVSGLMKTFGFYDKAQKETSATLDAVMDSVVKFRNQVRLYGLAMDEPSSQLTKEEKRNVRKSRASLIQACDELRDSFKIHGVQLKDHGTDSSWGLTNPSTQR